MKGQKEITGISSQKMELSQKKKLNSQILMKPSNYLSRKSGNSKISLKVNKILIKIQSENEFFKELKGKVAEVSANLKKGIATPVDYATVSFPSLAEMRSTFTPNRLKLLSAVRHLKPGSVYELSKILNRDRRHIMNDIKMLKDLGVLEVRKAKANGRKTSVLSMPYDEIEIALKL